MVVKKDCRMLILGFLSFFYSNYCRFDRLQRMKDARYGKGYVAETQTPMY